MKRYLTSFSIACCTVFLAFLADAKQEKPYQLNQNTPSTPLTKIGKESPVKKTVISTKNRSKNNKQNNQKHHASSLSLKKHPPVTGKITIHITLASGNATPKKDWLVPCKKNK